MTERDGDSAFRMNRIKFYFCVAFKEVYATSDYLITDNIKTTLYPDSIQFLENQIIYTHSNQNYTFDHNLMFELSNAGYNSVADQIIKYESTGGVRGYYLKLNPYNDQKIL